MLTEETTAVQARSLAQRLIEILSGYDGGIIFSGHLLARNTDRATECVYRVVLHDGGMYVIECLEDNRVIGEFRLTFAVPVEPAVEGEVMCDRATAERLKTLWVQAQAKGTLADFVTGKQGYERLSAVPMVKARKWISELERRIALQRSALVNPGAPTGIAINQQADIEAAQTAWLSLLEQGIVNDDEIRAELRLVMNLTEEELDFPRLDSGRLLTIVQVCNDWRAALEGNVC